MLFMTGSSRTGGGGISSKAARAVAVASPLSATSSRGPDQHSTGALLACAAAVPVWAWTVLPLTITYQVGKLLLKPVLPKQQTADLPAIDTGYVVDPNANHIIPRERRPYDVVVLGATGFTGRLAVRHLAKTYGCGGKDGNSDKKKGALPVVKWAIAGRSQSKLDRIKKEIADELNMEGVLSVDTIVVDTSIPSTIPKLVERTRVVATTAGPFALYGSPVVEFCAKFGTHYVDITGETDWSRAVAARWQDVAVKTGAKLVSCCGHDSVPWDLCVMKLQELLQKERPGESLSSVTFWNEVKGAVSGGTLATVYSIMEGKQAHFVAKEGDLDPFVAKGSTAGSYSVEADLPVLPAPSSSPWHHSSHPSSSLRRWTTPSVMALANLQVVQRSYSLQATGAPRMTYKEVTVAADWKSALVQYTGLVFVVSALMNPVTGYLLKRFVLPKPGEGPKLEDMEQQYFLNVLGEGVGTAGSRVQSVMYFPKDPGYLETARMLVESGLCLALQEEQLPAKTGGFWTPATALGNVLLDRLVKTGTKWEARMVVQEDQDQPSAAKSSST